MDHKKLTTLFDYETPQVTTFSVPPPSIIPVIILCGSDYQMGYQYGQQAGRYIEILKDASWVQVFKDQSREEVIDTLNRFRYYIDAYTPEAIEQMKGIVDGATAAGFELSFDDVLVINCLPKKLFPNGHISEKNKKEEASLEECSVFAAWGNSTTDGRFIFGDSKDSIFNHQVVIVAFPDNGNSYMTGVRAGELSEHFAMNNKGVFIGTGLNPSKRNIDLGYGLPKPFLIQHILRFTRSAAEGKDMFLSWEFPSAVNFIFADIRGDAYVVERTAAARPVRKSGDNGERDFIYSTNNVMTDDMKSGVNGKHYIEHAGWEIEGSAIPRSLELWNMFHNYHGEIDLEFVKMMWRFNDNPHPYYSNKEKYSMERDQKICLIENMRVTIGMPDDGDEGIAYICTGPAGRSLHPPILQRRDCFQISGTHSFYKLRLASSPDKVVVAAKNEAHDCLSKAYHELMVLKYTDAGYNFLNDVNSQAIAEYYDGVHAYNRGVLTDGNESLLYFSQAATAFTRSQAHAKQVYNALVPPAIRPKDLGLKVWGYWNDK